MLCPPANVSHISPWQLLVNQTIQLLEQKSLANWCQKEMTCLATLATQFDFFLWDYFHWWVEGKHIRAEIIVLTPEMF